MDPVRRDGRDRERVQRKRRMERTAEGAVMGVMVKRMPVRVLVLCVGFVVASLQCTIIC